MKLANVHLLIVVFFFLLPPFSWSAEKAKPINPALRVLLTDAIDSEDSVRSATAQAKLQTLLETRVQMTRDPMAARGLLGFLTSEILNESPRFRKLQAALAGWGLAAEPTFDVPPVIEKLVNVDPRLGYTAFLAIERTLQGRNERHRLRNLASQTALGARCEILFTPTVSRSQ